MNIHVKKTAILLCLLLCTQIPASSGSDWNPYGSAYSEMNGQFEFQMNSSSPFSYGIEREAPPSFEQYGFMAPVLMKEESSSFEQYDFMPPVLFAGPTFNCTGLTSTALAECEQCVNDALNWDGTIDDFFLGHANCNQDWMTSGELVPVTAVPFWFMGGCLLLYGAYCFMRKRIACSF
ncbi:MAG: hypothetical protein LBR52_05865 [Prevotellaceae bacterium]|jgi:hypothetical protein|nr:hypothetical protein [Prevotellaceae bacterium]